MNAYFVWVYLYFGGKIPQKGAYPLHIPISNDCIYSCLVNRNQLLGDAVLVILLVISEILKIYIILDLYNDPLYFAPLRSKFWNYSHIDIIELHAFYVGQH